LSTVVNVFLANFWAQGGLAGATQADAFYVKCDSENNTLASVQNGEVNIEVGVAVQYPAEFVIIQLSQQAGV
jgi:phage tail sheath protein FI